MKAPHMTRTRRFILVLALGGLVLLCVAAPHKRVSYGYYSGKQEVRWESTRAPIGSSYHEPDTAQMLFEALLLAAGTGLLWLLFTPKPTQPDPALDSRIGPDEVDELPPPKP